MARRHAAAAALALLLSLVAVGDAGAVAIETDLTRVRAEAVTVVIGVVHVAMVADTVDETIDVDTVLRGPPRRGRMKVLPAPEGAVDVDGARVVAFVDAKDRLRWVGLPVAGPSIEAGVLRLHGFFDRNAHTVSPGLMSLAQLRAYLATGRLDQSYRVTLAFPDGHGGLQRSSRSFVVHRDPFARQTPPTVTGFSPRCLTAANAWGLELGRMELSFMDACSKAPGRGHDLELTGPASGLDPATGDIEFTLEPTRPLLYASELDAYLADPSVVDVQRAVRVTLAEGAAWTLRVGMGLVDPRGAIHAGTSVGSTGHGSAAGADTTDAYGFEGGVTLSIKPTAGSISTAGSPLAFVQLVESGRVTACTFSRPGAPDVGCTLRSDPPFWVRR